MKIMMNKIINLATRAQFVVKPEGVSIIFLIKPEGGQLTLKVPHFQNYLEGPEWGHFTPLDIIHYFLMWML